MALTPEQKKRVQERAQQLIAQGVPTVQAVDKAFTEVGGEKAFGEALQAKGTVSQVAPAVLAARDPFAYYEDLPRAVARRETEAATQQALAQKGLAGSKAVITAEKGRQLAAEGVPDVVAQQQAARAFEQQFNTPMGRVYGGFEEKKAGGLVPEAGLPLELQKEEPSVLDALRTRSYIPQEQISEEKKKQLLAGQPTWGNVYNQMRLDNPKMSSDELNNELWALKSAYDAARVDPKNAGKSPDEVFDVIIEDLRQINYKIGNKSTWRKDPEVPQEQKGLMTDPLYAAFQKQTKAGEGFPDLSPVQIAYLTTQKNKRAERRYAELQAQYANKDIIDTEELPGPGGTTKIVQKKLEGAEKNARLRQMAENEVALPFWADAEKLQTKLTKPPQFALLSQESPYGTTRETNLGWLLRSAMVVPNAAAGAVFPVLFTGRGQTRQDILAERKERRPDAYKESPILLNVAEGRGFVGEAVETADIMGLKEIPLPGGYGNVGQLYTAGAFAADILDPSLDVIAGTAKAGRVALQTYQGAKAVGLTPSVGKALARGAAEGAKEIVSTSAALSTVSKAGGKKAAQVLEPGDLRFWLADQVGKEVAVANEVKRAIETGGDVQLIVSRNPKSEFAKQWAGAAGATDAEKFANVRGGAKYLDTALDNEGRFNNFISGAADQSSAKEVLGALSSAAAKDRAVASKASKVLEGKDVEVPEAAGGGVRRVAGNTSDLLNLVRADADVANAVRSEIVGRGIINEVYKNTADVNAFDNYVRVTKNTWATPQETQRLMESFKSSDFGKTVGDLNKLDVTYGRSGQTYFTSVGAPEITAAQVKGLSPAQQAQLVDRYVQSSGQRVLPGIKMSPEQAKVVKSEVDTQKALRKVPENYYPVQEDGFISFKDLRNLIDNNIDAAAATKKGAVDAATLRKLAPRQSLDITIPVEARSFTHSKFKDWWDAATSKRGVGRPDNLKLPAPQRAAISDLTSRLQKSDVMLRNEITKIAADADYRKAVTGSEAPISRSASVAYAAFPPNQPFSYAQIEKVLRDTANSMLVTDLTREDAFSVFNGLVTERGTDIWSTAGRAEADEIVGKLAIEIKKGEVSGDAVWQAIRQMHNELVDLSKKPGMLKDADAKVTDIIANSGADVLPPEMLVSTYYRAEAARAVNETMRDIVSTTSLIPDIDAMSNDALLVLKNAATASKKTAGEVFNDLVIERLKTVTTSPDALKGTETDALKAFGVQDTTRLVDLGGGQYKIVGTPPIINLTKPGAAELLQTVDDYAKQIAEVNGFKTSANVEKKIENISNALSDPTVYRQAEIVFGEDVAQQLKAAFAEGGAGSIDKNMAEALEKWAPEGGVDVVKRRLSNFGSWVTDLFYTGILTAAPRFHFGNIMGAPGLVYSTTGKLPNPESALQALEIIGRAGTAAGDTAKLPGGFRGSFITDAAGRTYTPNELYEAFSTGAGESTSALGLADVQQKATLRQLEEGKTGFGGRAWELFKRTPQNEDLVWRITVGIDALKQGRSLDEAKELARRALYDTGDITETEKKLQRATMFYSFTRNNFVNLIKNMTDPLFFKRIAKVGAAKRGADIIIMDAMNTEGLSQEQLSDLRKYAPPSTGTRAILGFGNPIDGKPVYIGSPSDSTLSALDLFGNLLAGQSSEILTGMLRPETKMLLNLDDSRDLTEVPQEHIYLLQKIADASAGAFTLDDLIAVLVTPSDRVVKGDRDFVLPIDNGDGTRSYKLTDPVQQKTYTDRVAVLNYLGLMRVVNDLPNSVGAPGSKVDKSGVDALLYAINLNTPLKGQSPMMQRAKNLMLADKEAASWARDLSNKAIEDVKAALPATPAEQKEMDVRFQKTQKVAQVKAERTSQGVKAELIALKRQLQALPEKVRNGELTRDQAIARKEQLQAEMQQLNVERKALEAQQKQRFEGPGPTLGPSSVLAKVSHHLVTAR